MAEDSPIKILCRRRLLKLTEVFLRDDDDEYCFVRDERLPEAEGDSSDREAVSGLDDDILLEEMELSGQMSALGLPATFHSSAEGYPGSKKAKKVKNLKSCSNRPTMSFIDESHDAFPSGAGTLLCPATSCCNDEETSPEVTVSHSNNGESCLTSDGCCYYYLPVKLPDKKSEIEPSQGSNSVTETIVGIFDPTKRTACKSENCELTLSFGSASIDGKGNQVETVGESEVNDLSKLHFTADHIKMSDPNPRSTGGDLSSSFGFFTSSASVSCNSEETCGSDMQWMAYWDDFYERYYFYNIETLETTWSPPEDMQHLASYDAKAELENHTSLIGSGISKYGGKEVSGETVSYDIADQISVKANNVEKATSEMIICSNESCQEVVHVYNSDDNMEHVSSLHLDSSHTPLSYLEVPGGINQLRNDRNKSDGMVFDHDLEQLHTASASSQHLEELDGFDGLWENEGCRTSCEHCFSYDKTDSTDNLVKEKKFATNPGGNGSLILMGSKGSENILALEAVELCQDIKGEDNGLMIQSISSIIEQSDFSLYERTEDNNLMDTKRKKKSRVGPQRKFKRNWNTEDSGMLDSSAKNISKYWRQRYSLFSRFDLGVKLDEEAWFSVTPEALARHHSSRFDCSVVVDCFSGVGGNAIQFAKKHHVVAIDVDPQKIDYARHNASIYEVLENIDFITADFMHLAPTLKADVVFMSPPWGGPDYVKAQKYDIMTMLKPCGGKSLFKVAKRIASKVVMYLPRNIDLSQLVELSLLSDPPWSLEVEKNYINGYFKAITAYFEETPTRAG